MDYVIYSCTKTLELFRWGRERGLWIPLRLDAKGREVAAMPGYIFGPRGDHPMRDVPPQFAMRVFKYREDESPWGCSLDDLVLMQTVINEATIPTPAAPQYEYSKGERIRIIYGPFKGIESVIEKVRDGTVRLVTRRGYLSLPKEFIAPLRN